MDLLTDLQVVDCSSGISGGYCAKLLTGAGAEVIKVESPDGDPLRRWTNRGYWDGVQGEEGDGALFQFLHFGHRSIVATHIDEIADLLAGADILITSPNQDAQGLVSDPAGAARALPAARRRVDHALRPRRSVRRSPRHRAHAAGRERRALGARTRRPRTGADGWAHHGVGEWALRRGRRAGRAPRRARRRAGRARRRLGRRGGEHNRHDRRRPHGLAARPAQPWRARSQLRDAVDRADVRRLRRLQHQHPHPVRQLPPHDRAPRPHRGWGLGPHRRPRRQLGGVERHHPRVHDEAHHGRGRRARGRAAHPGGAGVRRPRGGRVRAGQGAWVHRRRPDRHLPGAHPVLADRR